MQFNTRIDDHSPHHARPILLVDNQICVRPSCTCSDFTVLLSRITFFKIPLVARSLLLIFNLSSREINKARDRVGMDSLINSICFQKYLQYFD